MFLDLTLTQIVIFIGVLLISVTLHEAMHAFASYWLGDPTAKDEGRLTLNPAKHIDPYLSILLPLVSYILFRSPILAAKPVPFNPNRVKYEEFGAAAIGVVGPLTNLLLAAAVGGFYQLTGGFITSPLVFSVIELFVFLNVLLCLFNMIPFPPLDGSRLLYAFAPEPLQRVMATIEQFGIFGLLLFFVLVYPLFGGFIIEWTREISIFLLGLPI